MRIQIQLYQCFVAGEVQNPSHYIGSGGGRRNCRRSHNELASIEERSTELSESGNFSLCLALPRPVIAVNFTSLGSCKKGTGRIGPGIGPIEPALSDPLELMLNLLESGEEGIRANGPMRKQLIGLQVNCPFVLGRLAPRHDGIFLKVGSVSRPAISEVQHAPALPEETTSIAASTL